MCSFEVRAGRLFDLFELTWQFVVKKLRLCRGQVSLQCGHWIDAPLHCAGLPEPPWWLIMRLKCDDALMNVVKWPISRDGYCICYSIIVPCFASLCLLNTLSIHSLPQLLQDNF